MLMMGNLDADSGVESFALYAELAKSHKWWEKVSTIPYLHVDAGAKYENGTG